MKYVIYARVSTQKQDIRTQIDECVKFCGKKKYVLFEDDGQSSGTPLEKRQVLLEAIESLEKGDVLVVYKMDRLARDVWEAGAIKCLVKKQKATIFSVTEPEFKSDDPNVIIQELLMAWFSQIEKIQISIRTKSKLAACKARGERCGEVPYGYQAGVGKRDENRKMIQPAMLAVNPQEMAVIQLMDSLRSSGLTYREIAQALLDQGIYNRKGKPFHYSQVHRVLCRHLKQMATAHEC